MTTFLKTIIVALLTWEARMVLKKYKPFIVAVTGSVGKTGTKDAIHHVLKDVIVSRKSEKSFNSEIGIPLTVLGLPNAWHNPLMWAWNILKGFTYVLLPLPYPKLLVLEIGADHPGDITRATAWVKPDIAVITRLPDRPVHVENFAHPEAVTKEKSELVRALREHGVFVGNADDLAVLKLQSLTRARMLTYGFSEGAQVRGSYMAIDYDDHGQPRKPIGMIFRVDWQGSSVPVRISGVIGEQPCMVALAALAVGIARGESLVRMAESLATLPSPPGRMSLIAGKNDSIIIDDSYNASPVAGEAALRSLATLKTKDTRIIAMLGDMLELGQYEEEEHRKLGRFAATIVDILVVVGKRATWIAEEAQTSGLNLNQIYTFDSSIDAGEWLSTQISTGDIVLAKGSQGGGKNMIRMERAVKLLMAKPEDAVNLLVRQEKEWQKQY